MASQSDATSIIYISYNSILEPLVESQVLGYLEKLRRTHGYHFRLLTFEPNPIDKQTRDGIRARLSSRGLAWTHLRYHKRPSLLVTLLDILVGSAWLIREIAGSRPRLVHARSHVPALMALIAQRFTHVPFLFDCRGMFADAISPASCVHCNSAVNPPLADLLYQLSYRGM